MPLIPALQDTSDPIKWYERAMLVSDFGTNAEAAVPLLLTALAATNDIVVGHAAIALGRIRKQPEVCVPALIPLLKSPSVSTRQKSLGALASFGMAATAAAPAVAQCMADPDPWVRMQSARLLKQMNPAAAAKAGVK